MVRQAYLGKRKTDSQWLPTFEDLTYQSPQDVLKKDSNFLSDIVEYSDDNQIKKRRR